MLHRCDSGEQNQMIGVNKSVIWNGMRAFLVVLCGCIVSSELVSQETSRLTEKFNSFFEARSGFSGNVLVAVRGVPVYHRSFGQANLELKVANSEKTKFRIGSISKQFTSMAIMILAEQRKLNLSDRISKYIEVPSGWSEITIHQLLTHTSGLMHSWQLSDFRALASSKGTTKDAIKLFKSQPLKSKPGTKFLYSGLGYFLLAQIIEEVSKTTFESFLKENIFDKIGMVNTGIDYPNKILTGRAAGYTAKANGIENSSFVYPPLLNGGGSLYSTTGDLLLWDRALRKNKLISQSAKSRMLTPEKEKYAYGWRVLKSKDRYLMKHNGKLPGFFATIARFPKKEILVVVLTNVEQRDSAKHSAQFIKLAEQSLKSFESK